MLASKVTFALPNCVARSQARVLPVSTRHTQVPARCWRPSRPRTPEPLCLQIPGHQSPPGYPQPLVSLARTHRSFFLLQPMRLSILETVESLTETPHTRRKNSRLWGRVASGCSSRFASKSFLALSSSFGLEPGGFFGASDLPLR